MCPASIAEGHFKSYFCNVFAIFVTKRKTWNLDKSQLSTTGSTDIPSVRITLQAMVVLPVVITKAAMSSHSHNPMLSGISSSRKFIHADTTTELWILVTVARKRPRTKHSFSGLRSTFNLRASFDSSRWTQSWMSLNVCT